MVSEKAETPKGNLRQGKLLTNRRPRKKSTAQAGKPSAAPKTPQTQQTELHRRSRTGN